MSYPLEQLETIKKKKLEDAEKNLRDKKQLLIKEQEKLAELEKERDKVKEHRMAKLTQLRENLDAGTSTDKLQQMKQYLKVVDEQLKQKEHKVKEQQKQVDAAEKQVEAARQEVFKRHQDVEKMRLHHEEWNKQEQAEELRKEGIEGDELGSAMHTLRKREKTAKNAHTRKKRH